MSDKIKIITLVSSLFLASISQANEESPIIQLPNELKNLILAKIDIQGIISFCRSSTAMAALCDAKEGYLWQALVERDLGESYIGNPKSTSWKRIYMDSLSTLLSFTCPSNDSLNQALTSNLTKVGSGPTFSIDYLMNMESYVEHGETKWRNTTRKYQGGPVHFAEVEQYRRDGKIVCRYQQNKKIVIEATYKFKGVGRLGDTSKTPCYLDGLKDQGFFESDIKSGTDPSAIKVFCLGIGKASL